MHAHSFRLAQIAFNLVLARTAKGLNKNAMQLAELANAILTVLGLVRNVNCIVVCMQRLVSASTSFILPPAVRRATRLKLQDQLAHRLMTGKSITTIQLATALRKVTLVNTIQNAAQHSGVESQIWRTGMG